MRHGFILMGVLALVAVAGCKTTGQPVTETNLDRDLTQQAAPATPPPAVDPQARPGFEQESPKSQDPLN